MSSHKSFQELAQHGLSWSCQWLWHIAINYGGFIIITLGITLIVFCGLTFMVCVIPAITETYSWGWCILLYISFFYMFQILFNYTCATVFSAQLGSNYSKVHTGCHTDENACIRCSTTSEREMHQYTINDNNNNNNKEKEELLRKRNRQLEQRYEEYEHELSTLVEVHEEADVMSNSTTHPTWWTNYSRIQTLWSFVKRQLVALYKAYSHTSLQHKPIDESVLLELENLAHQAEMLPFHERRFILLDKPRRYCVTCERLKAPREHHCKVCNRCVAKMDHHCPWINNCVDLENERFFLLFLVHLWVACIIVCVILCIAFWCYATLPTNSSASSSESVNTTNTNTSTNTQLPKETVLIAASLISDEFAYAYVIVNSFPVFLLFTLSIVVIVFVGILLLMHLQEVCSGTTPIERLIIRDYSYRARRARWGGTAHIHSPYDLGSKWRNLLEVLQYEEDKWVLWYWQHREYNTQNSNGNTMQQNHSSNSTSHLICGKRFIKYVNKCKEFAMDAALLLCLVTVPSLSSSGKDGLHYRTFNQEVQHYHNNVHCIHSCDALPNQV